MIHQTLLGKSNKLREMSKEQPNLNTMKKILEKLKKIKMMKECSNKVLVLSQMLELLILLIQETRLNFGDTFMKNFIMKENLMDSYNLFNVFTESTQFLKLMMILFSMLPAK